MLSFDIRALESQAVAFEGVLDADDPIWIEGDPRPVREDCRGLCPQCGADLNAEPEHTHAAADPRWAALRDLSAGGPAGDAPPS